MRSSDKHELPPVRALRNGRLSSQKEIIMYAMYGKLTSQPGKRSEFAAILTRAAEVVGQLPGCRLYIVHEDTADETTIAVYEAWDDKTAHDASLQDARVRALIAEAMPLMGGPPAGVELRVVGGHGLGITNEAPH